MNKKISVRVPTEMADFLAETGGGDRGRSEGVRRVVEFAQRTPRAFAAFLGGQTFSDTSEALRVAADALDIAADWDLNNVQVRPPKEWGLKAFGENAGDGWCATSELARKLREIVEGRANNESNC